MKQLFVKWVRYFIIIFFFVQISNSCDTIDSQVPDVPFTFVINLNIYNDLKVPGNSVYFPKIGFGGLIVSCETFDTYYAYDAACTYELSQNCILKTEGILGTCSCCKSQYVLYYGAYPSKGPAAAPLRQYQVSRVNGSTLRVYN